MLEENLEPQNVNLESEEKSLGELIKPQLSNLKMDLDRLSFFLKNRDDERLNPLLSEKGEATLRSSIASLDDLSTKDEFDPQELESALSNIRDVFRDFGKEQPLTASEDLDSLKEVDFAVGRTVESLLDLKRSLAGREEESSLVIQDKIAHLLDDVDEVGVFLHRKISSLRDYLDY